MLTYSTSSTIATYISEDAQTTNFGNASTLLAVDDSTAKAAGRKRTLIEFDLTPIPVNSTVTAVSFQFNVVNSLGTGATCCFVQLTRTPSFSSPPPWLEGTGASGSGATWLTYDGTSNWVGAGANNGVFDHYSADLFRTSFPGATGIWTVGTDSNVITQVQRALTNFGHYYSVMMYAETTAVVSGVEIDSDDSGTAPAINVEYYSPDADIRIY